MICWQRNTQTTHKVLKCDQMVKSLNPNLTNSYPYDLPMI